MDGTVDTDDTRAEGKGRGFVATCPHCGREVPGNMSDMHTSVCIYRPEMQERIRAALTSDVPGVGVRLKDYDAARPTHGAAHSVTLIRAYGGTWAAVLDAFSLTPWESPTKRATRTDKQQRMTPAQREQAACADVAAMAADARWVMSHEYDAAHTLHGYKVRDLPGVTVNGRACVAVMLR